MLTSRIYECQALQASSGQSSKPQASQRHAFKARKASACTVYDGAGNVVRVDPRRKRVKWEGDYVLKAE